MIKRRVVRFPDETVISVFTTVNDARAMNGFDRLSQGAQEGVRREDVVETFLLRACGVKNEAVQVEGGMVGVLR